MLHTNDKDKMINYTEKAKTGQTTRMGFLECKTCNNYKQTVTVPIDKKNFDRFDDHVFACSSLTNLKLLPDSDKTPEILEQISKFQDVITLGYN
jgi:hypothetical protein